MEQRMLAFYNTNAASYDKEQEEFGFVRIPEWNIALETIRKTARKNHSVLEIGAGTGRFTMEIAPLVKQVTAVDAAQNMLERMSPKIAERGASNIRQICGNFMAMPFDQKFDIIVSFSAIEYIHEKEALFVKISDLLLPGGHLIITTAHDTFFRWWGRKGNYYRQGIFMEAYKKEEMRRILATNGLQVKELTDLCLKSLLSKGILLFVHATK
jgi:Methylase involved in ubiquinone/menaquinone biosynthesis